MRAKLEIRILVGAAVVIMAFVQCGQMAD